MVRRVPILRQHDIAVAAGKGVDQRDHFIAAGDGQRAAGAEIGLDIHDQQGGVWHVALSMEQGRA
jgi:hypothetical protein